MADFMIGNILSKIKKLMSKKVAMNLFIDSHEE